MDEETASQLLTYAKALLLVQLQGLSNADDPIRTEVLLARSGLAAREIADLLGKTPAAVAKALQRAGKSAA